MKAVYGVIGFEDNEGDVDIKVYMFDVKNRTEFIKKGKKLQSEWKIKSKKLIKMKADDEDIPYKIVAILFGGELKDMGRVFIIDNKTYNYVKRGRY